MRRRIRNSTTVAWRQPKFLRRCRVISAPRYSRISCRFRNCRRACSWGRRYRRCRKMDASHPRKARLTFVNFASQLVSLFGFETRFQHNSATCGPRAFNADARSGWRMRIWSREKAEMGRMGTPASARIRDTEAMKPTTERSRTVSKVRRR